jgi:hypothetical protein
MRSVFTFTFLIAILLITTVYPQSGKISGLIKDANTNEALIGANIIVAGTNLGAATDLEGYYVILNVPPGNYSLRASMIGYGASNVTDVRVNIGQTTEIDFRLLPQTFQTEEVVVTAKTPVVQKDVSASTVNLQSSQFENLPIANVSTVVGLQAGIRTGSAGLEIRGGASNQTAFMVNGLTLRDGRDNSPFTAVSFTSVDEVQIQTGGFNAEYGNIRSGVVNVVTKEGKNDRYSFSFFSRIRPPGKKYYGDGPTSPDAYWIRPYVDNSVAWTGTKNGAWDEFTQRQYQEFQGWNSISEKLMSDDDPTNDLSPEAAQRLFLWEHRKDARILKADYDVDASLAGPVPFLNKLWGNLRFLASFRANRNMYIIPLATDSYQDYTGQLKLTADITSTMKITVEGLLSQSDATASNNTGTGGIIASAGTIGSLLQSSRTSYGDSRIFSSDYWAPTVINRSMYGAKFSNVLSNTTFYEAQVSAFLSEYSTNPGTPRNNARIYAIVPGYYYADEAPFGFEDSSSSGIGSNMRMGVGMSSGRDSSKTSVVNGRFDINSQIDKFNNIKAGFEITFTTNDVNYGVYDKYLPSANTQYLWKTTPLSGALYVQDKIEYEGMIANLGLRFDYSNANEEWYVIENPYDLAFSGEKSSFIDEILKKEPAKAHLMISPRIGVAFPITESSKLYFNYGHFRQLPNPRNLYMLRRESYSNKISEIADPNLPLQKTVAYELGYEQSLMEEYLIRIAGYYKDVSNQPRLVTFISRDNKVSYSTPRPDSYEDIRGFEITLTKNRGDWVQGFLNYTYSVETSGYFNYSTYYQNSAEQRSFERRTKENYQEKPVPQPYARANVDFFTPTKDFGPEFAGIGLLTDWRINVLGNWSSGSYFTWAGGGSSAIPGVLNNVQWNDYWSIDLRFSKNFKFGPANFQVFCDISNIFNIRYMSRYGFIDGNDNDNYMKSLHLPDGIVDSRFGYVNVPGEDRPGDYRESNVAYVPIVAVAALTGVGTPVPTAIYYEANSKKYFQNDGNGWNEVDSGKMSKILDEKAYIDMPNQSFLSFVNIRNVYWGLRFSLELF